MRMKLIVGALASVVGVAVFGLPVGEKTYLWPEGKMPHAQGHQIAATVAETKAPGFDPARNRAPHLQWYPAPNPAKKTDVCMIILSGGGVRNNSKGPAAATAAAATSRRSSRW